MEDPYGLDGVNAGAAGDGVPLRMGTFVSALLDGRIAEDVIRLPRHTLRPGDRLWVVAADETIEPRDVHVLRRDEEWVWVDAGLEPGARVTTTPVANPVAGTPVRLTEDLDREAFAARATDEVPGT